MTGLDGGTGPASPGTAAAGRSGNPSAAHGAVPDTLWAESLDELDRHFAAAALAAQPPALTDPPAGGDGGEQDGPCCESVEQWVRDVLAPTYPRRATAQFRWCAQWWRHPEAISRLEALWRSWEALRGDPLLGMASWLRDHLDAQLPVLCSPTGTFADCDPRRHFEPAEPCLPLTPAPDGWWDPPPSGPDTSPDTRRTAGHRRPACPWRT